ncbi:hypothetical protein NPIL_204521 [Nephila pilipes]|uniref:Uncharacterized protein n=1 Tax=Nephila pilipes TaxID=299642 RepID=A0A8X6QHA3_NEPPI|nr:hypothetical protein NPIL_204521 [Nephila pilipes]
MKAASLMKRSDNWIQRKGRAVKRISNILLRSKMLQCDLTFQMRAPIAIAASDSFRSKSYKVNFESTMKELNRSDTVNWCSWGEKKREFLVKNRKISHR